MRNIILLFLLLVGHLSYCQDWAFEKPDYNKIEINIKNKSSNLYYGSLMNRFLEADTTMTLEEKRHLYYGYTFDKNYLPYALSDYTDSLRNVFQKEKLDTFDLIKIIEYSNILLKGNPFDLNAINDQLYSLEQIGNKKTLDKRVSQLRIIVDALLSSGNGVSKEEAFYVIYGSHEYDILNILGFEFGGSQQLIENYDYLSLAENEAKIEGLYFEISPCLMALHKMFKKE